MRLPDTFVDEIRARTPLQPLVARRVDLKRKGKNWVGLCPLHNENTPSFCIYENQRFHCFGCGAHGDCFDYLCRTQGIEFREAVEILAREVGLEVPVTVQERETERKRQSLHGLLQDQAEVWKLRLWKPEGEPALSYLRKRGLADETMLRFRIGWANGPLISANPDTLTAAGLLSEHNRPFFRHRIMFPIHDVRGRVIGFSGRTLGDAEPKYLNGPDTELFSKRSTLYGLSHAKQIDGANDRLVIVEGQMDVCAAQQARIPAVAPLGTALTEDQLQAAWRVCPCPVLAFDGDKAGRAATRRAAEAALPFLTPDRTLRVASMPPGCDPDSLMRKRGEGSFLIVLDEARPLSAALFDLLRQDGDDSTPENRQAYRERLEAAAARIEHRGLSKEYRSELVTMWFDRKRSMERRPRSARCVVAPGKPVLVHTSRSALLEMIAEDIRQAKLMFAERPDDKTQTRLVGLCEELQRIIESDFEDEEEAA